MQVKVSSTWKVVNPFVKVSGSWKSVYAEYLKVNGAWKDVSTPGAPVLMDLKTRPEWNYYYGNRLSYVPGYNPPGECIPNNLNLYNSSITLANFETGEDLQGGDLNVAWQWFTIVMPGDQRNLPWPRYGSYNGITLHFLRAEYPSAAGNNTTRVWLRSYSDLPKENTTYKQLRI